MNQQEPIKLMKIKYKKSMPEYKFIAVDDSTGVVLFARKTLADCISTALKDFKNYGLLFCHTVFYKYKNIYKYLLKQET